MAGDGGRWWEITHLAVGEGGGVVHDDVGLDDRYRDETQRREAHVDVAARDVLRRGAQQLAHRLEWWLPEAVELCEQCVD